MFETQRQCAILPGIFQDVASVGAKDNLEPELARCLCKGLRLVAGGGTENEKVLLGGPRLNFRERHHLIHVEYSLRLAGSRLDGSHVTATSSLHQRFLGLRGD